MRGTGYAIAEIVWWLMAAAFIGFLIGWLIRTWSMRNTIDTEWQERVDAERTKTQRIQADLDSRSVTTQRLEADLAATTKRLTDLERDHAAKVEELRIAGERRDQRESESKALDASDDATAPVGSDVAAPDEDD